MLTEEGEDLLSLMQRCVFPRRGGKGYGPFLSGGTLVVDVTEFHSRRLVGRGSADGVYVYLRVSSESVLTPAAAARQMRGPRFLK